MTITEKTAYLKGLLEGMEIDQSTKEGKLLAAIVETLDDIALSVADLDDEVGAINDEMDMLEEAVDAMDEALDDVEDALDAIDEDLYQLTCPTCEEEIIVDEDVLAKGSMKCPACGEDLEFDLSEVVDELDDEDKADED